MIVTISPAALGFSIDSATYLLALGGGRRAERGGRRAFHHGGVKNVVGRLMRYFLADEIQNDDSLQQVQAPATSLDFERVCVLPLPPSDAPRFCPYAGMTRESTMYRPYGRCTATTTKGKQCFAWRVSASACFI
jgi:hypothetical protein